MALLRARVLVGSLAIATCIAPLTNVSCGDDESIAPGGADGGGDGAGGGGEGAVAAAAPFGLDTRPPNPTCKAPPRLYDADGIAFESAFEGLTFAEPTQALFDPIDDARVYVLERAGVVKVFANEIAVTTATVMINISSEVSSIGSETGLLAMAFDPNYETNHFVYLSYTGFSGGPVNLGSIVVRYETKDGGETLDPTTKTSVFGPLVQPFDNHNGGHIAFGPDGFLYYGLGDGGASGDATGNAQNKDVLFGKLLRIDVATLPYTIPPTNPFAAGGGQKEIYAYGLRNPWSFQWDKANGDLWLGDVGEETSEEIDKIVLGGNYGWNQKEGKACFDGKVCSSAGVIDPMVEYGRADGASIVGGFVYRGTEIPKLVGSYIYGDTVTGSFWALPPNDPKPRLLNPGGPNPSVVNFAADAAGELFVVSFADGKIYRIIAPDLENNAKFPLTLSATGCFDPADPKKTNAALIPYGVNSQLWSDGASKERFFAIPDEAKIDVGSDGDMDLPAGSVVVKTFAIGGKRVETRLFVHHDDGWGGYTYEWNDAETDATLLSVGKTKKVGAQDWYFPTRGECMRCHTNVAGGTLGLEIGQLNGDLVYPATNRRSNQIDTLAHLDMFTTPQGQAGPRIPKPDGDAPLAERARAYLHANCSMCHRPGSSQQGTMDFRFTTLFKDENICDVEPGLGTLGVAGAKLFAPGDPAKSIIAIRTHAAEKNRMPPLATRVVDPTGTLLLDDWIRATSTCP